jgi:hypothetical protein
MTERRRADRAVRAVASTTNALALGPADERRAPGPALRQRVIGLCDRCQAALERSRSIRAQRAELVASVLAGRVGARPGG